MFKNLFKPADTRTPQEKFNDMKKEVKANSRVVDRQIRAIEREMRKVDADIKKSVKQNASEAVLRIKCKNRAQMQKGIERLEMVKTNIESTLTNMQIYKAQILQADIMKKSYVSMKTMNESMNLKDIMGITAEFQREMEKCGMTMDTISDTFDALDPEVDSMADEETDKVLMEIAGMRFADLVDAAKDKKEVEKVSQVNALPSVPA